MRLKKTYLFIPSYGITAIFFFLLCTTQFAYSQEDKAYVIPDSLQTWDYKALYSSYLKNWQDTLTSKTYLYSYLKKATTEDDAIRMARAYCQLSYYAIEEQKKLALLDRSIALSSGLENKTYPIEAYSFKGGYYLRKGNYALALDNYLKIIPIAERFNNTEYLYITKHNIARIKTIIGKHDEALPLFNENFNHNSQKQPIDTTRYLKSAIALAESYRYNNRLDSASIINQKALQKLRASKYHHDRYYGKIIINEGINLFFKKNYGAAYDRISKGLTVLNTFKKENNQTHILGEFYLGKLKLKRQDNAAAQQHFIVVDSILQSEKIAPLEVRESYEVMINFSRENNNKEAHLAYIDKLLKFDSIANTETSSISSRLFKEFDTPALLKEKEKLISELKGSNKSLNFLVAFLVVLTLVVIVFLYRQYQKRKTYQSKFEQLIKKDDKGNLTNEQTTNTDIGVAEEIIAEILSKLDAFEEKQLFLKKNISVTSLAKDIKTNTKYLSKVINHHKQKNFANYINDLRIVYAVDQLKTNSTLKNYTIQGIAEEMGFNTAESFSSAFKKTTGIKTSYFIKKLNDLDIL
ncbi:AraC family transcriptional regulator [Aquimarina sp. AU474]|uniref:AraC family transcriptional regulator n=1 Tax=Aquimarina sp. AU474 TaxID=2108529 RepID=UPI000D693C08|nr:AraC family transcriptional regulator [Aquimarina sp. AU474]